MTDSAVETIAVKPDEWPDQTAAENEVLTNAQIPYANLAKHPVLSKRAQIFVQGVRRKWESETQGIREGWRWLDHLFRANSIRQSGARDVHVPEILKAHRSLVPRIEEAFLGNGEEWFTAEGRDREDRMRSAAVTSFLEFQLEQNSFRERLRCGISSICKYQVMCFKAAWETKKRRQVYHWIEKQQDPKTGRVTEIHKRQFKDIALGGNRIRQIDPHRMIVDAQRWDLQDLTYLGDFGQFPVHDVLKQAELYLNLDVLAEKKKNTAAVTEASVNMSRVNAVQAARGGLNRTAEMEGPQPHGGPGFVELTELWCWFDFNPQEAGGLPDMREAVITVADNDLVLRLQENFHDDKHLPYAIGRSDDNGFEFFGLGLYEPAMRTQDEIDHFRASVYEASDVIIAPRLVASGPGIDLPNSLYDSPPGAILKDVGNVSWQPTPNTLQSVPLLDAMFRRDIEETIGTPRIWQGTESSAGSETTATEVRRKIEEGNRRLLGLITAVDSCCRQLLRIMHANNEQFLTDKQKYRVLTPKWAKLLGGSEYEIKPSDLLGPVDFTFRGVRQIQTYGLRGTNLLTFFQTLLPVIQERPDLFNVGALARQVYELMVGVQADDDVIMDGNSPDELESQTDENARLRLGQRVPVNEMDDDAQHLRDMEAQGLFVLMNKKGALEPARLAAFEHAQKHVQQLQKKLAQRQAMAQEMQRRALMAPGAPGGSQIADQNSAPPAGGLERGAQQTNGPGTPGQIAKAGRASPIEQTRNGNAA